MLLVLGSDDSFCSMTCKAVTCCMFSFLGPFFPFFEQFSDFLCSVEPIRCQHYMLRTNQMSAVRNHIAQNICLGPGWLGLWAPRWHLYISILYCSKVPPRLIASQWATFSAQSSQVFSEVTSGMPWSTIVSHKFLSIMSVTKYYNFVILPLRSVFSWGS